MNQKYEVILFWSNEDDSFPAEVPELPGCTADGSSYLQTIANIQTVIDEWIETSRIQNRLIPAPKGRLMIAWFHEQHRIEDIPQPKATHYYHHIYKPLSFQLQDIQLDVLLCSLRAISEIHPTFPGRNNSIFNKMTSINTCYCKADKIYLYLLPTSRTEFIMNKFSPVAYNESSF